MQVLTWNLFHGRAAPDEPRSLLDEFAGLIASWEWDVALLQEVPPWWPGPLARAAGATERTALTSRNFLLPLRRWIAERRPDLIRSNGGGSNAILVRGRPIVEHRAAQLRRWPERRVVHGVRLGDVAWVANLHAQVRPRSVARVDVAKAASILDGWAAGMPAVLGGDFNIPDPQVDGWTIGGGHNVDHVLTRGLEPAGDVVLPERGRLSDHGPVIVTLR